MTTDNILNLVLAVLAVYRLSRMIVGEGGPFSLFDKFRGYFMRKYPPDHWLYSGVNCPLCVSFWLALPFSLYVTQDPIYIPLYWLAIAGIVVIIYRRIE